MNLEKRLFLKFAFIFLSILVINSELLSQTDVTPFQIESSKLFEKLGDYKTENPDITEMQFADKANELLIEDGLNFTFTFNAETCKKIREFLKQEENKDKPVLMRATFQAVSGDKVSVILPEAFKDTSACSNCSVQVPLFEVKDDKFITKIRGKNIKFVIPKNFNLHTLSLVEKNVSQASASTWVIPNELKPVSISPDSSVIYFELADAKFKDLALAIYSNGNFSFFVKKDLIPIENYETLESVDKSISLVGFGEEENKKILGFKNPCNYDL